MHPGSQAGEKREINLLSPGAPYGAEIFQRIETEFTWGQKLILPKGEDKISQKSGEMVFQKNTQSSA